MRNYKKYVMFIGPITNDHGQGRVTSTTFKILKNNCSVDFINTHIKNLNIFTKLLISFLIIIRTIILLIKLNFSRKEVIIYFTPSRNILSSTKDLILLMGVFFFKKFNKKLFLIGHLHGSDLAHFLDKNIYGKLLDNFYHLTLDKLIINSQSHKKYALGFEFKKYEIINNPFQLENYLKEKINNKLIYKNGEINIVFISIPSKEKGLLESINLISKVFKNDDWSLNVIGWSKKNFIEVYFNESNLDVKILERVNFLGKVNDKEKYDVLLKSHLFVLLSYKEAQPLSVIEAGIFKCGIILSDIEMLLEFKKFESVLFNNQKLTKTKILKVLKSNASLNETSNILEKFHSLDRYKKNIINSFII